MKKLLLRMGVPGDAIRVNANDFSYQSDDVLPAAIDKSVGNPQ